VEKLLGCAGRGGGSDLPDDLINKLLRSKSVWKKLFSPAATSESERVEGLLRRLEQVENKLRELESLPGRWQEQLNLLNRATSRLNVAVDRAEKKEKAGQDAVGTTNENGTLQHEPMSKGELLRRARAKATSW